MNSKILAFESRLTKIVWVVCAATILFGTAMVFMITVARYGFGISWEWAEELSRYCIIFAALLGSGPMVYKQTHICMDLLSSKIKSRKLLSAYNVFTAICLLIISILLFIWGCELVAAANMRSYSLIFPMKAIYAMIPVSMVVMSLYSILKILAVLTESEGGADQK